MDKERKKQKNQSIVTEVQRLIELKWSNYQENKIEKYHVEKEQQVIKSENCMTCDKYVGTGVQRKYCQRLSHFKCEGATKEKVMQECPEEMQCISKKDKVN